MADLTDLQAAQTVKLAGASSSGNETGFIAEYNAQISGSDILNGTALQTVLSVGTTAVAARVGANNLVFRKMLIIQCQTANMTYGFASGSQPFTIPNNTTLMLSVGPNVTIYLRRTSGSGNVVIAEVS